MRITTGSQALDDLLGGILSFAFTVFQYMSYYLKVLISFLHNAC